MNVMVNDVVAERGASKFAALEILGSLFKTSGQHRRFRRRVHISQIRRGGSIRCAMSANPDATTASQARCGFTSAPGILPSMRRLGPAPTIRSSVAGLSGDHGNTVGAQLPAWNRLYELAVGA